MEQNTTPMNIYDVIILDESGSMSSIYQQALTGINEVIGGIRRNQEDFPSQRHFVTIVTFEGNGVYGIKMRRDRVPVEYVKDFTGSDYRPGGCTPLYDAMGKTLSELEEQVHEGDRVFATVITDGYENSSSEYSGTAVKKFVERLRKKGWTFAYIGANQDAVEVAKELNIPNALNFDATPEGTVKMCIKYRKANRLFSEVCANHLADTYIRDLFADAGEEL